MVAMAKEDDIVITRNAPSKEWRKHIVESSMELPQFLTFDELPSLKDRKLGAVVPWSWTPKTHQIAAPLSESTQVPPPVWQTDQADLFKKSFAADCLSRWLRCEDDVCDDTPYGFDWFTGVDSVGHVATNEAEVIAALAAIADHRYEQAIVKQDLSASGQNQKRISCKEPLSKADQKWLQSVFGKGQIVVVEPELDRVLDLSFLWHLEPAANAATFMGWTRPIISTGRRYTGTKFGNVFGDVDAKLKRFLLSDRAAKIHSVAQWLEPRLMSELSSRNFAGYFGVDALVCRANTDDQNRSKSEFKIKPLVELNPRMTMGHIALKLSQKVASGVSAEFRILNVQQFNAARR